MSSSIPDYYKILQIRPTASPQAIETAYRQLARIYHPDRNMKVDTTPQMQAINVAYSVLSNPQKRLEYDLSIKKDFSAIKLNLAFVRWAIEHWTAMNWDARLTTLCISLSIFCVIGIANNLIERQIMTSTHMAVNATVVAMQIEQSVVATVVAISPGIVADAGLASQPDQAEDSPRRNSSAPESWAGPSPVATQVPSAVEAVPVRALPSKDANLDDPGHIDAKAGYVKRPPKQSNGQRISGYQNIPGHVESSGGVVPINMIQNSFELLFDNLVVNINAGWEMLHMQRNPHARQIEPLPSSFASPSSSIAQSK